MLQKGGLVGRIVSSGSDAVNAAAEGADLVFLQVLHTHGFVNACRQCDHQQQHLCCTHIVAVVVVMIIIVI